MLEAIMDCSHPGFGKLIISEWVSATISPTRNQILEVSQQKNKTKKLQLNLKSRERGGVEAPTDAHGCMVSGLLINPLEDKSIAITVGLLCTPRFQT